MSCRGGSCSCKKGLHSSEHQYQTHTHMIVSQGELTTQEWMKGLESLSVDEEVVEIWFKNNRRIIYLNTSGLKLRKDDRVVVEASEGYDLGTISLTGELAQKRFDEKTTQTKKSSLNQIYRLATQKDLTRWLETAFGKKVEMKQIQPLLTPVHY